MMRGNGLRFFLCAALLCGCAAPDYQSSPSDKFARVLLVHFERPHLCVSGKDFALKTDTSGFVAVPAGNPVHLTGFYGDRGGSCNLVLKFTPQAGQTYEAVTEASAERCRVTVMVRDPSARLGLRLEPSAVNAPRFCEKPLVQ